MTVQKNLRVLKTDCEQVVAHIEKVVVLDKEKKGLNMKTSLQGAGVGLSSTACCAADMAMTAVHLPALCPTPRWTPQPLSP